MYINQKLIAERAGVSCATVSRAFTKSAKVNTNTMKRIQNAMEDLGINDSINLLSQPKVANQVLIIVGDISDEFYANTIKGISDQMHSLNMIATLCSSNYDFETEARYLKHAELNKFAGVIMLTVVESSKMIALLRSYPIPVILVNRYIRSLDMDVVCIDNYRGGYMAACHLIEQGHNRIAYLSGPRNSTAPQDRLRGFTDAMADAGLSHTESDVYWGDNSRNSGREFANRFFSTPNEYTAFFASNNPMAIGALTRLLEMGYRIPDDVSSMCFDDTSLVNDGSIKLTTISYDPYLMGTTAVDTLVNRIQNPLLEKIKITYSPHVTMRESIRHL